MGVGAIIGGVASLAAAGVSAAGSAGLFGGGGPKAQKITGLKNIDLPSIQTGLGGYGSQIGEIPGMQNVASAADTSSNQEYRAMIEALYPGVSQQISNISNIAQSYQAGLIPKDVQDQIQRATAQMSMQGGYGPISGMGRNLTARDLGLTSMNLQQLGVNMAGTGIGMAQAMTPSFTPVSSLLFTPAQILARTDQAAYYNTDLWNQQQILNSGIANAAGAAANVGGGNIGSGISSGLNQVSKLVGKGGALNSFFGGGKGGGAGTSPFFTPTSDQISSIGATQFGNSSAFFVPSSSDISTFGDLAINSTGGEF